MTENEFYEKLKEAVQEKMGDIPVELQESVKNNNITYTSILIGREDHDITPTIHLDSLYGHYKNGLEMDQITSFVIQIWQAYQKKKPDISIPDLLDWQKAKEKNYIRLFSAWCNPRYIQEGGCPGQQHLLFCKKRYIRNMKTKIQTLKEKINNPTDPRRTSYGNIRHKLEDIIIIALCTVIAVEKIILIWRHSAKNVKIFA